MSGRRRSVVNEVRREQIEEERAMSVTERVARAEAMFEEGLAVFMATQKVSREDAIRLIRNSRQDGRRRSRCMEE